MSGIERLGQRQARRRLWRRRGRELAKYLPLVPFLIFALFPLYFMLVTSLKSDAELYDLKAVPFLIQQGIDFGHYLYLLSTPFLTWMKNSLLVSSLSTAISVCIGILAAYSLARLRFPAANSFGTGIFITYLVPTSLLFLPLSRVIHGFGLSDSKWALVLTYPTFLVPFSTWLLMGYFRTVPKEVEECAMVDGCTRLQALIRIVLPMAIPGIVCAVLFSFTLSWNEFIYALTFTSSSEELTATVGITTELIRGDIYYWGSLMAGAMLGSIPIVLVYVFFMDYYVSGLTAGAVK
ncbi:MAG: sugar ABC transporter permease [Candidatus Tectimicrobiota bacterium]|nr:MAG: sugar ABC transporter permease [Candidatus Tectomicrobia bacterium]